LLLGNITLKPSAAELFAISVSCGKAVWMNNDKGA
jgi:hypothetical protein